jgi:hypothetical protein
VLPRFWVVLLALLLLAAPAGSTSAEIVDAQPSVGLLDDEAVAHVRVPAAAGTPARALGAATPDDAVPPAPVIARIFRPPRPGFD